jgi:hypothetical protein
MHSGRPPTADYSDKLSNSRGVSCAYRVVKSDLSYHSR